jgi:hypothetical protein
MASLANLERWSRDGNPPPHGEPIRVREQSGGAPEVERDRFGNAVGGVRTPALDVPIARYHARMSGPGVCELWGYREPFAAAQLKSLHPTHAGYISKVRRSVAALVVARWLTPGDAERIIAAASAARVP